ncbi:hypothetical protein [Sphingobacterium sp.]|uniref:hypothetical protein n=1 Tax=Sphingobacterium sp. TaxID=341027 RepID=UPI0028982C4B|nr:hypothetical protein [Sphingobacterium sp.]
MEAPIPLMGKPYNKFLERGIIAVTIVDIVGSLLSRWLNFDYGWFSIFSVAIYIGMAYLIARKQNLKTTLWSTTKLALYDTTIGFMLSLSLEADTGYDDKLYKLGLAGWLILIIVWALLSNILGLIGYKLAIWRKNSNSNSPAMLNELE